MDKEKKDVTNEYKMTNLTKHKDSYVSEQEWSQVFDAETALMSGTIFPELLRPFYINDKYVKY